MYLVPTVLILKLMTKGSFNPENSLENFLQEKKGFPMHMLSSTEIHFYGHGANRFNVILKSKTSLGWQTYTQKTLILLKNSLFLFITSCAFSLNSLSVGPQTH